MVTLHVVLPPGVVPSPFSYAGGALVAAGIAMIVWSRRAFQGAGTPITPFTESTALIRHGLYRWTRNPMYLGGVIFVLASPFWMPLLIAVGFFVILQEGFIRHPALTFWTRLC